MIPLFCIFPSLAAKQKKKETAKAVSLRPSKKWQSHFFEKDSLRFAPQLSAYSATLEGAHVAAENRFYSFHVCGRETLRGFFNAAYLSPRTAANILLFRSHSKSGMPFFDYFLSPAKCSRVSLITTGLSSSSAMRFGMDMRPLSVSEISHTSFRSATAPATTTRQKTI